VPTFRYVVADVFTDRPLTGNQLAVFTDAREIPDDQLQPLAKEMNFSETVVAVCTRVAGLPTANDDRLCGDATQALPAGRDIRHRQWL